jgi:hypothetical protein
VGPSLLRNAIGWETSRTHGRHRSCERYRPEESRRVPRSRSSEVARNHQPITTLPGKAEDIWPALSALHRERAEDRPDEFGPPQGVSHHRDLRTTSRQAHYSSLGELCTLGDQVDGDREMVFGTEEGKPSEKSETVRRSDGRQDPTHHAPGLQARAATRISAPAAGRQSHELGEPADDERLQGGPHDADAGVRDSSEHSRAETHAHL